MKTRALGMLAASLAVARPLPAAPEVEAGETTRLEMVVTNQDLALVLETRRAELPTGTVSLGWSRLPSSARTDTWSVTNAREAGARFQGLAAPFASENALSNWVGRRVRVERPGAAATEAEILSVSGPTAEQVLLREGNDLVWGEPGARLVLPGAGETVPRSGRVVLRLASDRAGARELTSRYLVSDIGWRADYTLMLSADEKSARLEGWFTVDNRTGASFTPTRLRLQAGALRVVPAPQPVMRTKAVAESVVVGGMVGSAEAVSESRIYDVSTPARLSEGRTTLRLLEDSTVGIEKSYVARGSYWFGENAESQSLPVAVIYRVAAKALAATLPAGAVRVYADGGTVFQGEDRIAHTPEKTDFDIETSQAFDLTAKRRQTSFTQTGPRDSEAAFEVAFASRKKEAATVVVRDNFPGDWTIVESSYPSKKISASTAEFAVPVPAGGDAKLTYRVRVRIGR
jgi:hypothetical protein